MHIPEQLFSLPLLKDVKTQPIELVFRTSGIVASGGAATFASALYTVPNDRVFCCTGWGVFCDPNAVGGYMQTAGMAYQLPNGTTVYLQSRSIGFILAGAPCPQHLLGDACDIWLPPGGIASVLCTFSGGGVTHNVTFSLTGVTFPRGSVALA